MNSVQAVSYTHLDVYKRQGGAPRRKRAPTKMTESRGSEGFSGQAPLPSEKQEEKTQPVRRGPTPGRNDPCWCGSGKKYKACHLRQDEAGAT